jgi:D-psicose/D-tagatose/L-ribulose 3-epimerase
MKKLTLCNEVIRELPFAQQCAFAAKLGYQGLEVAPFTLGDDAYRMPMGERAALRRAAEENGIAISGLHWLLVAPEGLSITTSDRARWEKTVDVMRRLVELCADLGGSYLVHGSPAQRRLDPDDRAASRARAVAAWVAVASAAEEAGVTYCIEPLAPRETDFVNTLAEAAVIVGRVGIPAFRTMIDTSAAAQAEAEPVEALVTRWMKTGLVAHVQLNDRNRRGPGQGSDAFTPIVSALKHSGYDGWLAIEPFDYVPDGQACAARAIGYVAGILEAIA